MTNTNKRSNISEKLGGRTPIASHPKPKKTYKPIIRREPKILPSNKADSPNNLLIKIKRFIKEVVQVVRVSFNYL